MKTSLGLEQKQILKLSQEMKLSLQVLSMPYRQVLNLWNGNMEKTYSSTEKSFFENLTEEKDFYTFLEEQLLYINPPKNIRENLIFCIYNLNSSGFLEFSDIELCKHLGISMKELKETYEYLHTLHPIGVGAHNFRECIRLQLQKKKEWNQKMEGILLHLQYIADGNSEKLRKKLGITKEEFQSFLNKIKNCNPIPARGYFIRKNLTIVPDFVLVLENEVWIAKENTELRDSLYSAQIIETPSIKLLRLCIEKRMDTLKKIVDYVVEYQKEYFKGENFLHTLHEKQVAHDLNLHLSTVSRAIQNKYLKTEKGIYSIKSLFCYEEKREKIKMEIERLIKYENYQKPYTDTQIQEELKSKFGKIPRRTIAKYRQELGYVSSFYRKIR